MSQFCIGLGVVIATDTCGSQLGNLDFGMVRSHS